MKNLYIIYLLFLLVTVTFSLDNRNYLGDKKCPKGTQIGCAAFGPIKSICRCVQKCKEDEYNQCSFISVRILNCHCQKRFNYKKASK